MASPLLSGDAIFVFERDINDEALTIDGTAMSLEFYFHLAVLIDPKLIVNFDSFDYPANGGALSYERIDSVLAF